MRENSDGKDVNALMTEIREVTKHQKSASRVDEIRVMRTMLNDPDFTVSVYDRNRGLIGKRCPREEAVKFVAGITSNITGLDIKSATECANKYEFTKKDAMFFIDTNRDFNSTYLSTGRKLPIIQSENAEAAIFYRPVETRTKSVPGTDSKSVVPSFNKVVCRSKSPKYNCM